MAGFNKASAWIAAALCGLTLLAAPQIASAAAPSGTAAADPTSELRRLTEREAQDSKEIDAQAALIAAQADALAKTKALLEQQQRELDAMKLAQGDLQSVRAAGMPGAGANDRDQTVIAEIQGVGDTGGAPTAPVGEAPPAHPNANVALALPQGIDVLTPKGKLIFDNAAEYQDSQSDRLVFSGIEIASTVELGVLEANQTRNDSAIILNTLRYGLTDRIEIEGVLPWVARYDTVTTVQTANNNIARTFDISGVGIGDVEGTIRYQFTSGDNGRPIWVGALRVVSDSGIGPFDVNFNGEGVATKLPTGSGFWAINPNISVIYPLDPIVVFASFGYEHSFGRNIDKIFGTDGSTVDVGHAQPGDSVSAAVGFAFSVNSRFSFSLGYKDNYFLPSVTYFLPTSNANTPNTIVKEYSLPLQDGVLLAGASYRLNNHVSLNLNFEFGVTPDAPNDTIIFRIPYMF